MSFILDALRKSDARRKQGNVPDIHTPEPSGPPPRRRGRFLLWSAVALVVGLITAIGLVLVLRGGLSDILTGQVADDELVTDASDEIVSADPVEAVTSNEASGTGERARRPSEGAEETRAARRARALLRSEDAVEAPLQAEPESQPESESEANAADPARERRRRRAPLEGGQDASALREARQRETEPVSAEVAAEEIARRLEQAERSTSDGAATARSDNSDSSRDRAAPTRPPAAAPADPDESDDRGVAGYVEAWDLPLSVRRSLPELVLNIHVYSQRPSDRFVLINGERFVEGESVGDGVDLVEIRREGAVVDFRSHRFLLRRQ